MSVGRAASIACDRRGPCPLDRLLQSRDLCLCVFANFLTKRSCAPCSISMLCLRNDHCDRERSAGDQAGLVKPRRASFPEQRLTADALPAFSRILTQPTPRRIRVRDANCLRVSLRSTSFPTSSTYTDMTGAPQAPDASMLYALEIAPRGGDARLANTTSALVHAFAARR